MQSVTRIVPDVVSFSNTADVTEKTVASSVDATVYVKGNLKESPKILIIPKTAV